ncbi:hypothetical protein [Roseiconus lacunae]|uniref:Uncharacterized protein n=1 Tax=Roseiconus lacunae TaxID=2605694 RepID=A0ABT7PBV3_9BACT|nr:hypothetical protein [Roseiconus lacunae]MCD0463577.1 hypothetical protein [Roseiconus lacunae]MDM4013974.1 hypothetical protein [Roseiconus lacunae]WRQ53269.1 hypothetical protein U8335_12250 [Stieleria sp. HD01]
MKQTVWITFLTVGFLVCSWFTMAAAFGWKAPSLGVAKAISSGSRSSSGYYGGGRSYGGSWGFGK